ncbi:MAG: carboxypeptidase regulatory-like domain-containing protein, partial [Pyrinomonadaceae bacterium]|nr:carboxypeptidase regulatory-like domain-containing protein [Pyrinomonadaceae bacterium]
MNNHNRSLERTFLTFLLLALSTLTALAQQNVSTLRGRIADQLGGLIVGAAVTLVDAKGVEKTARTNEAGIYKFDLLAPGKYILRASAVGFAAYENTAIEVGIRRSESFDIELSTGVFTEEVTVGVNSGVTTDSDANADAVVLRGSDLDALPNDPELLASSLQAIAGPGAGGQGGQVFVDGFTGGRLPPKESIREVRVSQNPLNAEYDRPGFG